MALIKCPECKKKISDQCENCPQCGYPINSSLENEISNKTDNQRKKPFYKKIWVWIVAGVVLLVFVLGTILLLNRDTQPKLDEDGNPVFVELTNEVYTNAKKYKGYHINIKGKVFQVMSDNGSVKGIQVWLDPDTCEQNLMIYYNTDVDVKQGDYIMCSGYIDSVTEYKNAYDAKLFAPLVISSDLKKSTYKDVMAPTTETIVLENIKQEKYGYSVLFEKIEFSEKETRVYVTAKNDGKETLYFDADGAVILQDSKQYNAESNYEANYDEIPYEIVKGATSSGIIVFPSISKKNFDLTIDIHSDESDEKLGEITIAIGKEKSEIKTAWPKDETKPTTTQKPAVKPTYPSAVGTYYCSVSGWDCNVYSYLYIYSDGTLYHEYIPDDKSVQVDTPNEGTWVQNEDNVCYNIYGVDGFVWNNPFYGTVYSDGIEYLGDYYTRQ